jgi:hypothetical protein
MSTLPLVLYEWKTSKTWYIEEGSEMELRTKEWNLNQNCCCELLYITGKKLGRNFAI